MTHERVALIPARGGSKRLPGKNTRPFFGHPALAYAIVAAQNSNLFSHIIVSTDDPATGEIAEWYGAEYLPRPAALATDEATLVDVAEHVLNTLKARGVEPTALCQLMPNCPLRRSEDVVALYRSFEQEERPCQISVVPYRGVYPHWALTANEAQQGRWVFGNYLVPSQQLGVPMCPTGAVWWVRVPDFIRQHAFYGDPFYVAAMDGNRGIDIDRAEEFELAELLVRGLHARDGHSPLEPIHKSPFPNSGEKQ